MLDRGRAVTGEDASWSKLTEQDVREIRRRHSNGETLRGLSEAYRVAHTNIWAIVHRVSWKHLE